MRKIFTLLVALALPLLTLTVQALPAQAADPLSAQCSNNALVSLMGVHLPASPDCSTGPAQCPPSSPGCAYSASIKITSAGGLGTSRGLLRLTNPDTGQYSDFYCGGSAKLCNPIVPTTFLPASTRMVASCSVTNDNILISPVVTCSQSFSPLGEG